MSVTIKSLYCFCSCVSLLSSVTDDEPMRNRVITMFFCNELEAIGIDYVEVQSKKCHHAVVPSRVSTIANKER
ncbi:hypothetical protein Q1695_002590 [Nippostrongylus brasiliensis]|nr:hypothetical protein Q1695_002590 [Nippostrongylus brasiliensis]